MDRDDDLRVISRFVDVLRFPPFAASRREIAAGSYPRTQIKVGRCRRPHLK